MRRLTLALLLLLALAAACDRSPTPPETQPVQIREMILVGDDGVYVFSHADHWHGAPVVRQGGTSGQTLHFTESEATDHVMPPIESWFTLADHPDLSVRVVIEDPAVATWSGDRTRGTLGGLRAGASRMTFVVLRGTTTIFESPPLNFRVQEP
jgi:hypothetical protein